MNQKSVTFEPAPPFLTKRHRGQLRTTHPCASMDTVTDQPISSASMYGPGQVAVSPAVSDKPKSNATFQAPSSRSSGGRTPVTRPIRKNQATPGNDSGTVVSDVSVGDVAAVIPTTSTPPEHVDASLPNGNQQASSRNHTPQILDDDTTVASSPALPPALHRSSFTQPTMSKRKSLFNVSSQASVSLSPRERKHADSEDSEGEDDKTRPSSSVAKTYGGRRRAARTSLQTGTRKSHRASTGPDPLRLGRQANSPRIPP